jgi:uncharacterized protein YjeT (DUF2065 family)
VNDTVYYLLRFLHITATATWIGAALWVPGDVRRTLARGAPHTELLVPRVDTALKLDLWAGIASILTGLVLMLAIGGHPATRLMVGLGLALVLLGLVAFGVFPAWRRIKASLATGGDPGAVKKLAAFNGIAHALWLAALATMVFDNW